MLKRCSAFRTPIALTVILVTCVLVCASCQKAVKSIKISNEVSSVAVGDKLELTSQIEPQDATNKSLEYIVDDNSVASVNGSELTAKAAGSVVVTVRQNNKEYDHITLSIKKVMPTSMSFGAESINVGKSRKTSLEIKYQPQNTTDTSVTYTSTDTNIAQIEGANVLGIAEGSTTITATHASGISTTCTVNVIPVPLEKLGVSGLPTIKLGSIDTIKAVFTPADTTDQTVAWKSSDENILAVDADGKIYANRLGSAKITATHASGVTAEYTVEVLPIEAQSITLNASTPYEIYPDGSVTLEAVFSPENTTDKSVKWVSDNPSVATVSDGEVTGVAPGTTTIRAIATNKVEGKYTIIVKPSSKKMKVSITCSCSNYNSVGNEWVESFSINGSKVSSGSTITVKVGDSVSFYTIVEEQDKVPDIGTGSSSCSISEKYFESGFTMTQKISVQENRGRYSGNVAVWTVVYTFTPY